MSKENEKTVEVYKKNADVYLATSVAHDKLDLDKAKHKREKLEKFIKKSLDTLPEGAKVLEIGSGDGSNAEYIKELGYDITASDIAEGFINAINNKGLKSIKFNILEDKLKEKYSAVFCWRVLVHFTKEDVSKVLRKVYDALEDNGLFIFNVMNREVKDVDEEWVDFSNEYHMGSERYYKYFTENELNEIINKTGYKINNFNKEGGEDNNKWLIYVLKK